MFSQSHRLLAIGGMVGDAKKNTAPNDKETSALPASVRRFPFTEGDDDSHPISDWKSSTASKQVCSITTQPAFPLYHL